MWEPDRPQWIIVVEADRSALYGKLRQSFDGVPWVVALLDRRRGDRDGEPAPPQVERPLPERRRAPDGLIRTPTHRVADQAEGFAVYQATGPTSARCEACRAAVWFEMPRFAEPPARLEVEVRHEILAATQVRHFVELRASTLSGRLLLASRILGHTAVGRVP